MSGGSSGDFEVRDGEMECCYGIALESLLRPRFQGFESSERGGVVLGWRLRIEKTGGSFNTLWEQCWISAKQLHDFVLDSSCLVFFVGGLHADIGGHKHPCFPPKKHKSPVHARGWKPVWLAIEGCKHPRREIKLRKSLSHWVRFLLAIWGLPVPWGGRKEATVGPQMNRNHVSG